MTAEASSSTPAPRPQCPRCGTVVPLAGPGIQVIRCTGCGAALQVSVRPAEPPGTASTPAPPASGGGARPRRRPMVEVSGPRRAEAQPVVSFTVELSQSDIDTRPLQEEAALSAPAPAPASPTHLDTPWFAEDIERLPEANVDLGQLALESFEPFPPLPQRAPTSHSQGK
ncbi:hypothetical protein [Archangium sp.]|uniref:hypothetical protein n=1 Tax=Archangium sp. TaxID=1872627 RepID=UPI002D52ADE2|nr:hypothetical protein [Archangium sp.]HYO57644.1 hypothetical protein [Archangium sp.]